ncbi:hypothetical protein [Streptococcus dysgalactiae]|uniref:hypothetical protein n=1 Tax=Streptococcus dysgalactiae TaxID=1334 RepID=UPI0039F620EB
MQKLTSKWKSLNKKGLKKGLKLSLFCALNWLIVFIAKAQFFIFSVAFLGTLTYYLSQDYRIIIVNFVPLMQEISLSLTLKLLNEGGY